MLKKISKNHNVIFKWSPFVRVSLILATERAIPKSDSFTSSYDSPSKMLPNFKNTSPNELVWVNIPVNNVIQMQMRNAITDFNNPPISLTLIILMTCIVNN